MSETKQVSESRTIAATPEQIFDVLRSPSLHSVIDGSGMVKEGTFGPEKLSEGDEFGQKMQMGFLPYKIKSTVVEFEENRRIAWAHFGKHRWRYELEPVEGGTLVTETFDWSHATVPKAIELMGYPKKHPANMRATLERLDAHLTKS